MVKRIVIVIIVSILLLTACTQQQTETSKPASTQTSNSTASSTTQTTTTSSKPKTTPETTTIPQLASLKVIGQIGGPVESVAASGKYAYVGVGMRVMVLDISNPAAPSEIGATQPFAGEARDIAISGNFAYVAAAGAGLYIVNIINPSQPITTGQLDTKGYAEGVTVAGKYAYVADGPFGLLIIDVSDPAKPEVVAGAYGLDYVFDVALTGNYAYLAAAGAGLLVVDISDPTHPLEIGSYDTAGYAYGIAISGNSVYVADGWGGVQIINISNPAQPAFTGNITTPGWAMDATIDGTNLYIADAFAGLRIVDITDNSNPAEIGSYVVSQGHAAKLAINSGIVYVADIYQGLYVVDVKSPSQPYPLSRYNPIGFAHAVAVSGNYAYLAGDTYGFRVIDLADPSRPREVAAIDTKGFANTIAVSGTAAYVATSGDSLSLYTFDISNALQPEATSLMPLEGHKGNQTFDGISPSPDQNPTSLISRGLFLQGTTLYNAGEWGLLLIDISNPLQPQALSFLKTTEDLKFGTAVPIGVAVVGNIAYIAASQGGFYTVDFSNPQFPVQLGKFSQPGMWAGKENAVMISDVVVSGKFAYVLDNQLLRILDVSDPRNIKDISSLALPDAPFNNGGGKLLAIDGNTIYIADNAAGLLSVDVTDATSPHLSGEARLSGNASWISLDEKYVYVTAREGGLYIIEKPGGKEGNSPVTPVRQTASSSQSVSNTNIIYIGLKSENTIAGVLPSNVKATGTGTTYTVSSIEDSGTGTLRDCLQRAQTGDIIIFDPQIFPPENPTTIYLKSGLMMSQGNLTIDGSNAGVILDGSSATKDTWGALQILSDNNVIKGMRIANFPNAGISISGQSNIIGGDRAKGKTPLGEGNLISGNAGSEVYMKLSSGNLVIGNYIGTDITGKKKVGHPSYFTLVMESTSFHNRIESNVIAGSILINDIYSSYNEIVGNYIDTDASGTAAFEGSADILVMSFNKIGGTSPEERNVINGRVNIGGASDVLVLGNYFGIDSTGEKALGVGQEAVGIVQGSRHNFIGGATDAERNVINGSVDPRDFSEYNFIMGNNIGTDRAGTASFSNSSGVSIVTSEHNFVQGNIISGSNRAGISLSSANFNVIRGNRIIGNNQTGIGIDYGENNIIARNSFMFNGSNGYDKGKDNYWDNGKQGNYWGDYKGSDKNGDGIGDTPYQISPNGVDKYPLIKPPDSH